MPLHEPRQGEPFGFSSKFEQTSEITLGLPEDVIWASIKQMGVRDVADDVLYRLYGIRHKRRRESIARSLKLYIQQAENFYTAASGTAPDTAPLLYYYAFLNLAKALCEIKYPKFHQRTESYRHGISWKPSKDYLVNPWTEKISLTTRGVWHILWEAVTDAHCVVPNPAPVRIKDLFALCPNASIEFERAYLESSRLIELADPAIYVDDEVDEAWIRFSVQKEDLASMRITKPKLIRLISEGATWYQQVKSDDPGLWAFEQLTAKKVSDDKGLFRQFEKEIEALNLFTHIGRDGMIYLIPVQSKLPVRMPQIIVLYSLIFWLGSLVRYDPHSVNALQETQYWILIDGFINQSRIWLLELFEWCFFQVETILQSAR